MLRAKRRDEAASRQRGKPGRKVQLGWASHFIKQGGMQPNEETLTSTVDENKTILGIGCKVQPPGN